MSETKQLQKDWDSTFAELASQLGAYEAWSTWIYITAVSFAEAAGNRIEKLSSHKKHLLERLSDQQKGLVWQLTSTMAEAFELQPYQDFIGERYMAIKLNDKSKAQLFTPYPVAQMAARLSFDPEEVRKQIREKGFITVDDCAIGAGALPIAVVERLTEQGIDIPSQVWVSGADVSEIALLQAYIQLSLLEVPAVLAKGDTIYCKFEYDLYTLAAITPGWLRRKFLYGLHNPKEEAEKTKRRTGKNAEKNIRGPNGLQGKR